MWFLQGSLSYTESEPTSFSMGDLQGHCSCKSFFGGILVPPLLRTAAVPLLVPFETFEKYDQMLSPPSKKHEHTGRPETTASFCKAYWSCLQFWESLKSKSIQKLLANSKKNACKRYKVTSEHSFSHCAEQNPTGSGDRPGRPWPFPSNSAVLQSIADGRVFGSLTIGTLQGHIIREDPGPCGPGGRRTRTSLLHILFQHVATAARYE